MEMDISLSNEKILN